MKNRRAFSRCLRLSEADSRVTAFGSMAAFVRWRRGVGQRDCDDAECDADRGMPPISGTASMAFFVSAIRRSM